MIQVISFGYGHGAPPAADVLYDLRALLHNPHHDPALRTLTGLDQAVFDHVMATPGAVRLAFAAVATTRGLVEDTGANIIVAWGCTGGRHRSVALARHLSGLLLATDATVTLEHRDVHRELLPPGVHSRPRA